MIELPNVERKSLDATIEDVGDSADKPFGGFVAIASTPSLDRDGDRLASEEWLALPDHVTIDSDHGMSVSSTIGSARPYFDDEGRLMIDAAFSSIDRAQEVRTLIKEGHIRTVSVAFLTDRSKKDGTPRRELLNVGVVAIPSNRDAVILDAKAADVSEAPSRGVTLNVTPVFDAEAFKGFIAAVEAAAVNAVESALKAGTAAGSGNGALVQAIHDAAGHLGAACVQPVVVDEDGDESGADDGANKSLVGAVIDGVVYVEDKNAPENADPVARNAFTLEQFKAALDSITSGADGAGLPLDVSPADAPVEEAAAATDDVPAPADDSAAAAVEAVASEVRASRMAMALYASEVLLSDD
jgi:phage head maturation protease